MNISKKIKSTGINLSIWWQNLLIKVSLNLNKPLNKPTSITFDLTPNCVLKCKQCDIWKSPPETQLSLKEAKIIIDRLHSWLGSCYLFFTGGEPLTNTDLPEIIGYAYRKGILSHINSNAVLIDKSLAKKLTLNHLYAISISLDGATAKTHDYLRGVSGTFDKVIKAINYLQKTTHSPKIYINTVIMKNNTMELEKLIELTKKYHTNGIMFQCLLPNLGQNSVKAISKNNPLWPNKTKITAVIKRIIQKTSSEPLILSSKQDLETSLKYYKNPGLFNKFVCAAGINNFIVDHHGDVRLCFDFPAIGNIIRENPQSIWWSQKAVTQRQQIRHCQRNCKLIACNKADTARNKTVAANLFE